MAFKDKELSRVLDLEGVVRGMEPTCIACYGDLGSISSRGFFRWSNSCRFLLLVNLEDCPLSWSQLDGVAAILAGFGGRLEDDSFHSLVLLDDNPHSTRNQEHELF